MTERSRERFTGDPFAITPDPAVYVPRGATETARAGLLRSACNPAKTTALVGPPGLGKTLLLHLLADDVPAGIQTVYLPYAALPPEELCAWALGLLDLPTADDPIAALQVLGRDLGARRSALLMLIDDAGAMPIATARWAGELVQISGGSLRLAVAASDNATGNRTIAAIGSNFDVVHLLDPMTEDETRRYIDGRLALARVPNSIRARFDDQTVRVLHRISAGIPRRLHLAAAEILQEAPDAPTDDPAATRKPPVEAPIEPPGPAQTIAASSGERRVSRRRAAAPTAGDERDEPPIADRAWRRAPAIQRRAPSPSRGAIALGSLFVAFAAVAIPVIRTILSEPRPIPAVEEPGELGDSVRGDLPEAERAGRGNAGNPDGSTAHSVVDRGEAAIRSAAPRRVEPPSANAPLAETAGLLAVQINATPWANVEVDGIDLGVTPLANIPLLEGAHSFRARMPDGRVIERTLEIDANKRFISFE